MNPFIFTILLVLGSTFAHPRILPPADSVPVAPVNEQSDNKPVAKPLDKFRQDGDDDDGVGEIEEVGNQVSTIISGVLGGDLTKIFQGSTGFIEDQNTQTGVGTLLSSVGKPLNSFFITSVKQGQQYFNITAPPTILLAETTAAPPPPPSPVANGGVQNFQNQPLAPLVIQPHQVGVASNTVPAVQVTPSKVTDDDEDEDNDNELQRGRVGEKL